MNEISPEKAFELAANIDNGIGGEICLSTAAWRMRSMTRRAL